MHDGGGPADGGVDEPGDGDLGGAVELNAGSKRGGGYTDDGGVDVAGVPDVLDGGQGERSCELGRHGSVCR